MQDNSVDLNKIIDSFKKFVDFDLTGVGGAEFLEYLFTKYNQSSVFFN